VKSASGDARNKHKKKGIGIEGKWLVGLLQLSSCGRSKREIKKGRGRIPEDKSLMKGKERGKTC